MSKVEPEQRRSEELVEDLAVAVDVVPDEVRLQRRDHRRDQADPRAKEPPAGLEDDDRRGDGDEDLHRLRPTTSGSPPIQKTAIRNQPYSGCV